MVNKLTCEMKLKTQPLGLLQPQFGTLHRTEFGHQRTYSLGAPTAR